MGKLIKYLEDSSKSFSKKAGAWLFAGFPAYTTGMALLNLDFHWLGLSLMIVSGICFAKSVTIGLKGNRAKKE